jgi:hypothetical protein
MSEQTDKAATPAPKPTIEELRAEIKRTRTDLGETVQALAAKADVKARAKEQVDVARERALETVRTNRERALVTVRTNQVPIAIVVAGAMAVVGIILVLRGRRR